jgi:hypothetical protein
MKLASASASCGGSSSASTRPRAAADVAHVRGSSVAETATAFSAILSAPQGAHAATVEVLVAISEATGDPRIRHAARYVTGEASPGAPTKFVEGIDEAMALVRRGATLWQAATTVANLSSGDAKERRNVRDRLRRRLKPRSTFCG